MFSPDSSHILLTTYFHLGYNTPVETQAVTLLDASGQAKAITLARIDVRIDNTSYRHLMLNSSYLQSGPYAGQILLVESAANQTSISVIDPNNVPQTIPKWTIPGDLRQTDYAWSGEVENEHGLLLVFQSTPEQGAPYLIFVWDNQYAGRLENYSSSDLILDWRRVDLREGESLQGAWLRSGVLVYLLAKQYSDNSARQDEIAFYPYQLTQVSHVEPPRMLFVMEITDSNGGHGGVDVFPNALPLVSNLAQGPRLLAHSDPGSGDFGHLAVTTYDGSTTVTLSDKGYKMYDWSQYKVFRGLR
jgi:hypothetical protein